MIKQNIFNNDHVTSNSTQLEILKKNFPNCFDKNGHFILDSFKEIIKENDLDFSEESYSLNWLGKSYAQLLRNEKTHTFIQPNHDHNNKEINKDSQNLLIKGDNLEVLKHLRNAYSEKIKMIYIDPPYNTGSDGFVYQDDRKFSKEELMHLAKVTEDEAKRILDFTAKGSNSHSAWLTFIYPRLYIARQLLREDGVIFISINDFEVAQLRLICNEIFGESNSLTDAPTALIWQLSGTTAGHFAQSHEYILCFCKNKSSLPFFSLESYGEDATIKHGALKKISRANPSSKILFPANKISIEGKDMSFKGEIGGSEKQKIIGEMIFKNGLLSQDVEIEAGWAMRDQVISWLQGKETFDSKGQKVLRFYFNSNGILWYEKERGTIHPKTILEKEKTGTKTGAKDLKALGLNDTFSNPKPVSLLKYILSFTTTKK